MIARNQICRWSITYSTGSRQWLRALPPEGKGKITEGSAPQLSNGSQLGCWFKWVVQFFHCQNPFGCLEKHTRLSPGLDFGAQRKFSWFTTSQWTLRFNLQPSHSAASRSLWALLGISHALYPTSIIAVRLTTKAERAIFNQLQTGSKTWTCFEVWQGKLGDSDSASVLLHWP